MSRPGRAAERIAVACQEHHRVEAAGCVRREPDPDDRRALQVTPTEEGVALLRRTWPVYAAGIGRHFAGELEASGLRISRA